MIGTRTRLLAAVVATTIFLAGCQSPAVTPSTIDLEGVWLVTPDAGTDYGAGGTTTVEFGAAASGSATFLSRSDANAITTCERHVYAALTQNVVLLDGAFYVADVVNQDRIVLDNDSASLTLDRVTGAPPVAPCAEATATAIETFDFGPGGFTSLNAFDTRLYFNTDAAGDPIVAYGTVTNVLGAPRTYSASVGGVHRWVVGARSDDLFYGHCGCGGSATLDRLDLAGDASIASVNVATGLGIGMTIRYGVFDGANILVGGRANEPDVNRLVSLNGDTLALVDQRTFLDGALVEDVALLGSDLLALVGDAIVVVGVDGRAEQTIDVSGLASDRPTGIAAIGTSVFVLDENAIGRAMLYEVALP